MKCEVEAQAEIKEISISYFYLNKLSLKIRITTFLTNLSANILLKI
jgi:hypothetical protein